MAFNFGAATRGLFSTRSGGSQATLPDKAIPTTVGNFLRNPSPTVLPFESAGIPALPLAQHMVAGSPYPHSAQTKLAHWNRVSGGPGMPAGVTYNTPRNRLTQT